ncbi:MAG: transaldolase, partial [Thermodesulfobacteriota bacterium]
GQARTTITDHLEEAERIFEDLKSVNIDINSVTEQLETEGVKLFSDSFFSLLEEIAKKRDSFSSR